MTAPKKKPSYRAVVGVTFPDGERVEPGEVAYFGDATEWLLECGAIEEAD